MDLNLISKILSSQITGESTTLLGWKQCFDELGRPINTNPNIRESLSKVGDSYYLIGKHNWEVSIYHTTDTELLPSTKRGDLVCTLDFTPEYLRKKVSRFEGFEKIETEYGTVYKSPKCEESTSVIVKGLLMPLTNIPLIGNYEDLITNCSNII